MTVETPTSAHRSGGQPEAATTTRGGLAERWSRLTDGYGVFMLLVLPAFLLLFIVTVIPLLSLLWTSLQEWNRASLEGPSFTGLSNYTELFADGRFWKSVGLTAYQVIGTVVLQLIFGMAIALLMSRSARGVGLARSAYLIPMMCTPVVVGLMWKMMLQTDSGPINGILTSLGLPAVNWLGSQALAMPSVIIADVWLSTPFVVIILVAGLQSIPREVFEAARVDGASAWQTLWTIILPMIKPMILLAILFRTMDAIKRFDTIYVMTGGGPGNATETLDLHAFAYAFTYLDVGKGAAVATFMLLIIVVVSSFLLRRSSSDD